MIRGLFTLYEAASYVTPRCKGAVALKSTTPKKANVVTPRMIYYDA